MYVHIVLYLCRIYLRNDWMKIDWKEMKINEKEKEEQT